MAPDRGLREKAPQLAAIAVALNGDVHGAEAGDASRHCPGQENQPGAGAEDRQPCGNALPQWLEQPQVSQQLAHDGALAAREDQPVQGAVQIPAPADLKVIRPQPVQHGGMLGKGALDR